LIRWSSRFAQKRGFGRKSFGTGKRGEGFQRFGQRPAWYIQRQDMKIVPGDKVEITGSRITFQGKPAIIAAEVKKGIEILKLRDENGFPVWSGWRRR